MVDTVAPAVVDGILPPAPLPALVATSYAFDNHPSAAQLLDLVGLAALAVPAVPAVTAAVDVASVLLPAAAPVAMHLVEDTALIVKSSSSGSTVEI